MNKIIKIPLNIALGITVETLYALCLMLTALFVCALVSLFF